MNRKTYLLLCGALLLGAWCLFLPPALKGGWSAMPGWMGLPFAVFIGCLAEPERLGNRNAGIFWLAVGTLGVSLGAISARVASPWRILALVAFFLYLVLNVFEVAAGA